IDQIAEELTAKSFVDEVVYDKPLISLLNENVTKISFWILVISAIFTFIAELLINSSIRLSVYSKRFTIKTMQMVGATKRFIRRPFVWQSVKLGMIGAVLALVGMGLVLYY
ncbi:cell division protein FtsX, partial [Tamlana crocina]|nr:ABC transporter permease [Tamlana crocina]